jgi:hypothetical protein
MDFPPNTAEEFLVFHDGSGDYETSNVQVVGTTQVCWTSQGRQWCTTLPAEVTATLLGINFATGQYTGVNGTLDIKLTYPIGATSRYTRGPIATTAGGSVTVTH